MRSAECVLAWGVILCKLPHLTRPVVRVDDWRHMTHLDIGDTADGALSFLRYLPTSSINIFDVECTIGNEMWWSTSTEARHHYD
jgi:hypothetical protein